MIQSKSKERIKLLKKISLKTIFFNFRYLPFKQAVKLPIFIAKNVYLRKLSGTVIVNCPLSTGLIHIGFGEVGIFDDKKQRAIWQVEGKVVFNGRADMGQGTRICVNKDGELIIGENFTITAESSIIVSTKVQFGKNCLLSWDVLIMDDDFHYIKDKNGITKKPSQPINIGNNVWIGCQAMILKSSNIPNNCVIGAKSLICKTLIKSNCLYAGNPVICVKEEIIWSREQQDFSNLINYK